MNLTRNDRQSALKKLSRWINSTYRRNVCIRLFYSYRETLGCTCKWSSSNVISRFVRRENKRERVCVCACVGGGEKKRSRIEANGGIKKWQARHRVALKQIPTFPAGAKSVSRSRRWLVRSFVEAAWHRAEAAFSRRFEKGLTRARIGSFALVRRAPIRYYASASIRLLTFDRRPCELARRLGAVRVIALLIRPSPLLFSLTLNGIKSKNPDGSVLGLTARPRSRRVSWKKKMLQRRIGHGRNEPRKEGKIRNLDERDIVLAYPVCKSHRDYEPREKERAGIGERALGSLVCHGTLYLIVQLRANP